MLLAIDVGNTNTVLGVFDGKKLLEARSPLTRADKIVRPLLIGQLDDTLDRSCEHRACQHQTPQGDSRHQSDDSSGRLAGIKPRRSTLQVRPCSSSRVHTGSCHG